MTDVDPRTYDAERLAKRAAIAARLADERREAEAVALNARLARESRQQTERLEREVARGRRAYESAMNGRIGYRGDVLYCHHNRPYDGCPTCQTDAEAEYRAEANANR